MARFSQDPGILEKSCNFDHRQKKKTERKILKRHATSVFELYDRVSNASIDNVALQEWTPYNYSGPSWVSVVHVFTIAIPTVSSGCSGQHHNDRFSAFICSYFNSSICSCSNIFLLFSAAPSPFFLLLPSLYFCHNILVAVKMLCSGQNDHHYFPDFIS